MSGDWKEGEKGEGGLGREGRDGLLSLFPFALFSSPLPLPFLRLPRRLARVNSVRERKVHKVYSMFSLLRTLLVEILTIGNNSH